MLSIAASIYKTIVNARNALYDKGLFETFDLGARAISIGNITTGGTGKTPLVAYVAEILAARGERVCILTRGYGRENAHKRVLVSDSKQILASPTEAGDEPFELAQKLIGKAIVIADADRVSAAEWAKRRFGVTVFVLDDGFQQRKVKRDVDIVCIDATAPFRDGKLLPAGRLRESASSLKRADIVVITRANLVKNISNLKSEIADLNSDAAVFISKNEIDKIVGLEKFPAEQQVPQKDDANSKSTNAANGSEAALAFCAIGNPQNFFEQLRQEEFSVAATKVFRDHYVYTQADIDDLERQARENAAQIFFTTAKDAVKLSDLKFKIPCFAIETRMVIDDPKAFAALL